MRGPSGEYIKVTALACEICGSESEILPSRATAYRQAVGRRLWERGRAGGGFPGEGRDPYVSPRVYLSTTEGVCRGFCPGGAGRRERGVSGNAASIGRRRTVGAATAHTQLWFGHPRDFHVPLQGERWAPSHLYQG